MGRPSASEAQPLPSIWQELLKHMPCLYDIKVECARDITKLTPAQFKKARNLTGSARQWPFVTVKSGSHRMLNWTTIRDMRGRAIQNASPEMREILYKVEKRAHLMRLWTLSREQRLKVIESSFFPEFPSGEEGCVDFKEVDKENPHTKIAAMIDQCKERNKEAMDTDQKELAQKEPRKPKVLAEMSQDQVTEVITHMIDIPVIQVTEILRISHHTLRDIRLKMGLSSWPYDGIRRGAYCMSAIEVSSRRAEMIRKLPPDSVQAYVLRKASELATTPSPNEVWQAITIQDQPEPEEPPAASEAVQAEEKEDDEAQNKELREWFASLLDEENPQTQQQAEAEKNKWVEEEYQYHLAKHPYWVETEHERVHGFSKEQQEYWDSLVDITSEGFC